MEIIPIYTPAVQISWLIDKSAHEWLARDGWSDNVLQHASWVHRVTTEVRKVDQDNTVAAV